MINRSFKTRLFSFWIVITLVLGVLVLPGGSAQALPSGVSDYFIPTSTQQIWDIFVDNDNNTVLVQARACVM